KERLTFCRREPCSSESGAGFRPVRTERGAPPSRARPSRHRKARSAPGPPPGAPEPPAAPRSISAESTRTPWLQRDPTPVERPAPPTRKPHKPRAPPPRPHLHAPDTPRADSADQTSEYAAY